MLKIMTFLIEVSVYLCAKGIDIASFYDISIRFENCPGSVVYFCFSSYEYNFLFKICFE